MTHRSRLGTGARSLTLGLLLLAAGLPGSAQARSHQQRTFETPEQAVDALIDAVRKNDTKSLQAILGPGSGGVVASGDPVADRSAREAFLKSYDSKHRIEAGGGKLVLNVGEDDFPLPIPLVPDGPVWRWDTQAGKEELLNRRIGRNELYTIQACLAYVDAQREYYAEPRGKDGVQQYAQRFASTPGKRDGLYWETKDGEKPSPLGPLVAQARTEGYRRSKEGPTPFHGYYYRILTAQGPNATDGALDYVASGRMIGGFAMVAYPAQYGASGITTFIVSHDGVVYQKDLGPNTAALAGQIKRFDPDSTWKKVEQKS